VLFTLDKSHNHRSLVTEVNIGYRYTCQQV